MTKGHDLPADIVLQALRIVGVEEAVPDPHPGADLVGQLVQKFERLFDPFLAHLARGQGHCHRFLVVPEHKVRIFASEKNNFPSLVPVDGPWEHVDAPNQCPFLPIEEYHAIAPFDSKTVPTEDSFGTGKRRLNRFLLHKIPMPYQIDTKI